VVFVRAKYFVFGLVAGCKKVPCESHGLTSVEEAAD